MDLAVSDAVWVRTEPSLDGRTYVVTVEASEDLACTLSPQEATQYALAVLTAASRADYDASVARQMTKVVGSKDAVLQLVTDLRRDRPPLDDSATAPLTFEPGVNSKHQPFLLLKLNGEPVGQWDVEDARSHALAVMEAVVCADLDSAYYRALTSLVGIEEPRARNVVEDLARWRS